MSGRGPDMNENRHIPVLCTEVVDALNVRDGGVYVDGMGHGVQNEFASIMAYPHVYGSATQYDYFSNPNWSVNGIAFGITNQAYAIRTVTATKTSIANFK